MFQFEHAAKTCAGLKIWLIWYPFRWVWVWFSLLGRHQWLCQRLHPSAHVCRCREEIYLSPGFSTSLV